MKIYIKSATCYRMLSTGEQSTPFRCAALFNGQHYSIETTPVKHLLMAQDLGLHVLILLVLAKGTMVVELSSLGWVIYCI